MKHASTLLAILMGAFAPFVAAHPNHDAEPVIGAPTAGPSLERVYGRVGDPGKVTRTVPIEISRANFSPAEVRVKRGETIRFVFKNPGPAAETIVLGTLSTLKERAAMSRKFPRMEINMPDQVAVPAGQQAELAWEFTRAGDFAFASASPARFEAGMAGRISVSER